MATSTQYAKYTGLGGSGGGGGGSGTVTSVTFTGDGTVLSSTPSAAVTTSGTLNATLNTQSANTVLAGPATGVAANPTFRALVAADLPFTTGNLTDSGTDGIVVTGGTGAVIGGGTSVAQHVADTTHNGYLASADWNTFNGKQASGNYITALTGDVTASGPGSAASTLATVNTNTGTFASVTVNGKGLVTAAANLSGDITTSSSTATLATVNSNVGSFGSTTAIPNITVNGKGLITAASTSAVVAPAGTLSGTTLNSTVVTSSLTSVGTIATGVWQGTAVAPQFGGTGQNLSASSGALSVAAGTVSAGTLSVGNGGTGNSTLTSYAVLCGGTTSTGVIQSIASVGSSGQVLTSNGASALPTFQASPSVITNNYFNGYMASTGGSWTTTSTSFATPTGGTNTLTTRWSNGLTVTAGATNTPAITFTPSASTAAYQYSVGFLMNGSTAAAGLIYYYQLTDGTNVFDTAATEINVAGGIQVIRLTGVYAPGVGTAVTLTIQCATGNASHACGVNNGLTSPNFNAIEWSLFQIR